MPFGNAVGEGFVNSGIVIANKVIIEGVNGELLVYSGTAALGNLIVSIAGAAGTDGVGNNFLEGVTAYTTVSGEQVAIQLGLGSFAGTPAAGLFTHDQVNPANSDPFAGSLAPSNAGCNAVIYSGTATALATGSGIECDDSVLSGVAGGQVNIIAGQTTMSGTATVQGVSLDVGNGSNALINLHPVMASPVNWPTAGKTLAQTQACLDAFIQSFKNRGMVNP
jgi:hypothetical protein